MLGVEAARAGPARSRHGLAAIALTLCLAATSHAVGRTEDRDRAPQAISGPITIVVAYPPGGVSDRVARLLAAQLALQMGLAVRVESQAGAGGAIALRRLARLPGDGQHLVFSAIMPLALDPLLAGSAEAIAPIASVMTTPFLLVGTPAFEGRDFADLLRLARTRPAGLRWATSGVATTGHLVLEQIRRESGGSITHVPYKGGGQQLSDALAGQFELLSTNVGPLQLAYIRKGRFVPLAVGAPERLRVLPQVPTLRELGFPQANHASVFGLFASGSTTPERIRRLNAEVNLALRSADIREALREMDSLAGNGSAAEFAQAIASESQRLGPLAKSLR
jgi:tripartite-type tricarboxylate transporter receptor subunit TctC